MSIGYTSGDHCVCTVCFACCFDKVSFGWLRLHNVRTTAHNETPANSRRQKRRETTESNGRQRERSRKRCEKIQQAVISLGGNGKQRNKHELESCLWLAAFLVYCSQIYLSKSNLWHVFSRYTPWRADTLERITAITWGAVIRPCGCPW